MKDPETLSCNVHPSTERWRIHKAASTTLAVQDARGHVGTKYKVGHCPLRVYPLSTRWHAHGTHMASSDQRLEWC